MHRAPDPTIAAAGRTVIDPTPRAAALVSSDAQALLADVRSRALAYLDDEVRTRLPRIAADLRRIVEDWSDADTYASIGATIDVLMADSPVIRGAVTRRLSAAPRLALANALADLLDQDPDAYAALQDRIEALGLRRIGRMRPEETACVLDRFGILDETLDGLVRTLGSELVVVPA